MRKSVEMSVFEIRLYCDECGSEMESDGTMLCSNPAQYPYVCPKCGAKRTMLDMYPKIEYRPKIN